MINEQRKFHRCPLEGDAVWIATQRPEGMHSALNISRAGVALEYFPVTAEPINTETIDIIGFGEVFHELKDIPCQLIYDICSLMEKKILSGGDVRIRGLKFKDLGSRQQKVLKELLDRCFERFT